MKSFNRLAIFCVLLFGLLANSQAMGQFLMFNNPMQGQPAPDFTLPTVQGSSLNMTAYRDGKPAIVFFWATWCPHCRQQLKKLYTRRSEIEEEGVRVILVDLQESARQVQSYLTRQKIDADICLDQDGAVSDEYGVLGIPTYFLIDAQGDIRLVKNTFPSNYSKLLQITP